MVGKAPAGWVTQKGNNRPTTGQSVREGEDEDEGVGVGVSVRVRVRVSVSVSVSVSVRMRMGMSARVSQNTHVCL